jgi:hypothetical protein
MSSTVPRIDLIACVFARCREIHASAERGSWVQARGPHTRSSLRDRAGVSGACPRSADLRRLRIWIKRARSRDIVAKPTFEQLGPAGGMRHAVGIVKSPSVDLSGTAGCRIEAAIYEIASSQFHRCLRRLPRSSATRLIRPTSLRPRPNATSAHGDSCNRRQKGNYVRRRSSGNSLSALASWASTQAGERNHRRWASSLSADSRRRGLYPPG